jgi:DNA mismatch endonuclease (patch repair protein)
MRQTAVTPSSASVSRRMALQPTRGTRIEYALRMELHRRGLRYRVHRRPVATLQRVADIVFVRARVAVFVDGCFWHGCPLHATWPMANAEFWRTKIEGNRERDRDTNERLSEAGWSVVRVWEHDDVVASAVCIEEVVAARLSRGRTLHKRRTCDRPDDVDL